MWRTRKKKWLYMKKHIEMVKFEKDGIGVERYMRSYSVRRVRGGIQAEDRLSCIFGE